MSIFVEGEKMKKLRFFLYTFLFSFSTCTLANFDKTEYSQPYSYPLYSNLSENQRNIVPVTFSNRPNYNYGNDPVATERQDELITEILSYALIIFIYSLYWHQRM